MVWADLLGPASQERPIAPTDASTRGRHVPRRKVSNLARTALPGRPTSLVRPERSSLRPIPHTLNSTMCQELFGTRSTVPAKPARRVTDRSNTAFHWTTRAVLLNSIFAVTAPQNPSVNGWKSPHRIRLKPKLDSNIPKDIVPESLQTCNFFWSGSGRSHSTKDGFSESAGPGGAFM
jgi:hypothetical protein